MQIKRGKDIGVLYISFLGRMLPRIETFRIILYMEYTPIKIKVLEIVRKNLEKLNKELARLEEQYGVLGTLANTADGQNSLRVSLQRFVLATRLDDVLIAASQRLAMMTKGRYRIQRNTTADDRRAAGGLELEVEDAYTGSCRPVSTLSGVSVGRW